MPKGRKDVPMRCPACGEVMEREDCPEFFSEGDRNFEKPAALYLCECGAMWRWIRGKKLEALCEPTALPVDIHFDLEDFSGE
jgi:hypothetical protein